MKPVLLILAVFVISSNLHLQKKDTILEPGRGQAIVDSSDTVDMEYYPMERFPAEPRIIYRPRIVTPDSLLPLNKAVKVIVKVEVDSTGKISSPRVLRSPDRRFDAIAKNLAMKYRVDVRGSFYGYKGRSIWLVIPIVFEKRARK